MKRCLLILLISITGLSANAQSNSRLSERKKAANPDGRFIGKYEMNGNIIQFALQSDSLVLIVPGAPIQELEYLGENKFKSKVFKDQLFVFTETNGVVTEVNTTGQGGVFKGKKIAAEAELLSVTMDSLLTLQKSTEHFLFRYGAVDAVTVDSI